MGSQHRSVIGVDPGKRITGVATFFEGRLWFAGVIKNERLVELPEVPFLSAVIVIEQPVVYTHGPGSKDDPNNNIIPLALLAGRIAGRYEERADVDVVFVTPRRWKGSVPKPITNKRTLQQLRGEEIDKLPKRPRAKDFDHNMLDAVGLALWQCRSEGWR